MQTKKRAIFILTEVAEKVQQIKKVYKWKDRGILTLFDS